MLVDKNCFFFTLLGIEILYVAIGHQPNVTTVVPFMKEPPSLFISPAADNLKEKIPEMMLTVCKGKCVFKVYVSAVLLNMSVLTDIWSVNRLFLLKWSV